MIHWAKGAFCDGLHDNDHDLNITELHQLYSMKIMKNCMFHSYKLYISTHIQIGVKLLVWDVELFALERSGISYHIHNVIAEYSLCRYKMSK